MNEKGKTQNVSKDLLRLENGKDLTPYMMCKTIDKEARKTYKPSISSTLSQVKNFMPKLKDANEELSKIIATSSGECVNIENIDGCTGPIVEMDLALVELDNSSEDEANTDSTDSNSDSDCLSEVTAQNLKLPNNKRPKKENMIEEIGKHKEKG